MSTPASPIPVRITDRTGESTPELKNRVRRFVELAEQVEAHRLTGSSPGFMNFTLEADLDTGTTIGGLVTVTPDDPDLWELLATRERTLVFVEDEPLHLTKVAAAIGREHPGLREATKLLGQLYREWKSKPRFLVQKFPNAAPPGLPDGSLLSLHVGPPTITSEIDLTSMTSDLELANLYLNSRLWHADEDKSQEWDSMTEMEKATCRKAAEGRAISGAGLVISALRLIRLLRQNGYDF
ncbi:hypothetical protein [Propionicimonas sp.]|uniref:hypothetical protein n=1 Tax=Propionicimonas sp. TaxID=1955623 RepID=UPI00181E4B30|nr:hypothetical protein [Propionicimonas sp.]MBU3976562.1 hypothetical protein [Actinomycetota bacterium]MBA3020438.1 hypothetical protein [Propionicimonas sp.]MBU3986611.1 hypothetical protein [Actinomycetota bacterium]MBU4007237.1 hypothetical protein [Actinomycetota bacterium]MBU4064990.1 hypothetical protein [Actinomycetota bacterium]